MDDRAALRAAPARPCLDQPRSASSRACAAPRYSWTSSSFGSGRGMACSYGTSNRRDSRCESTAVRVLQQRRLCQPSADRASSSDEWPLNFRFDSGSILNYNKERMPPLRKIEHEDIDGSSTASQPRTTPPKLVSSQG